MKLKLKLSFLLLLAVMFTQVSARAQAMRAAGRTSSTVTVTNSFVAAARQVQAFSITAFNSSTADLYLHVFDAASLPANGSTPLGVVRIPANSTGGFDWGLPGRPFSTGVLCAVSTTPITLTNGSAVFLLDVTYSPTP